MDTRASAKIYLGMPCLLLGLLLAGCGGRSLQAPSSPYSEAHMTADIQQLLDQRQESLVPGSCVRSRTESARDACYRYVPAPAPRAVASAPSKTSAKRSAGKETKKSEHSAASAKNKKPTTTPAKQNPTDKKTASAAQAQPTAKAQPIRGGMCQPQCLIYVRCRTGFKTCMLGNTTAVNWAACAHQNGTLSPTPVAGSAMLIDKHRNISSGHVIYVEEACKLQSGNWLLRVSHANYDGTCRLDLDSKAIFSPATGRLTMLNGPWGRWAKDVTVLGFVTG